MDRNRVGVGGLLLLVSVILFVLAAAAVSIGSLAPIEVAEVGLAFFAGAFLVDRVV